MKYTVELIQSKYRKKEKLKYLFFYGHQHSSDGGITASCLSQWWNCCFEVDGQNYHSAEQFMMVEKARLFGDEEVRNDILLSKHPKQAKSLGRQVKNFDNNVWVKNRFNIVKRGNLAKFSQNKNLYLYLDSTKDRILVEASPYDKIWGIGMGVSNGKIENPLEWKGLNLLGFALMEIRDELE